MAGVSKDGAAAHQPKGHIMDVTTEAAASGSATQQAEFRWPYHPASEG
jgi:hypothetical protein